MSDLYNTIAQRWRQDGISVRPGVSLDVIAAFEARYHVRLSGDILDYFLALDGMPEYATDSHLHSFWALDRVRLVQEELNDVYPERFDYPDCFVIGDHCIWCFGWAVELSKLPSKTSGPVYIVPGQRDGGNQIADTFQDFLERYAEDPGSIF